jgi:hypothetical protein
MTKGTLIFRIIISSLLGLCIVCTALFSALFVAYLEEKVVQEEYGIFVAGVPVTRDNRKDILGDGTVSYSASKNLLTFENATIEYFDSVVYSKIDIKIELIGENKFIMSGETVPVLYAGDNVTTNDIAIFGDGSLTVEYTSKVNDSMGIFGDEIRIESDITITLPESANISNGIYSEGNLTISKGATVTIHSGAALYSTAVKASNNVNIETGATLNVTNPGATELCRGMNVGGALIVWENATLNVDVDDQDAKTSECIRVYGFMGVKDNANVTVSSKKSAAIECYGAMDLADGATVSATTEGHGVDLFCYGAIVNHGATVNGEVEALGGVHNK